jgi:hypothetical protein
MASAHSLQPSRVVPAAGNVAAVTLSYSRDYVEQQLGDAAIYGLQ